MTDRQCNQCRCKIRIRIVGGGDPQYWVARCMLRDEFLSNQRGAKRICVPHSGLHVHSGSGMPIEGEYTGDPGGARTSSGSIYAITWRAFQ